MTHEESRKRRERIAAKLRDGKTVKEVSHEEKITPGIVREIAISFGIRPVKSRTVFASGYAVLWHLLNTEKSNNAIGKEMNVSRQYVGQVVDAAIKAGFVELKKRKRES